MATVASGKADNCWQNLPFKGRGLDSLAQKLLGALTQQVGQDVVAAGQWHRPRFAARTLHGGVLLWPHGPAGKNLREICPKVRRLFSFGYPQLLVIAQKAYGNGWLGESASFTAHS